MRRSKQSLAPTVLWIETRKAGQRAAQLLRHLAYLSRMDCREFPGNDPLRQLVERAYDATHQLSVELHYRSCSGGVGK